MSITDFDADVAKRVGITAAVVYENIVFWTQKKAGDVPDLTEDEAWAINTVHAWGRLFPYLTLDQIKEALGALVEGGYLKPGMFSKGEPK